MVENGQSELRLEQTNTAYDLFYLASGRKERYVYLQKGECNAFADLLTEHALHLQNGTFVQTDSLRVMLGHSGLKLEMSGSGVTRLTMNAGHRGEISTPLTLVDCQSFAEQLREHDQRLN